MTQASTVPTVIRALYTIAQTLTDTITSIGPGDTSTGAQKLLWIGVDDPDGGDVPTAIDGEWHWPYASASFRAETYNVYCAAVAQSGASDSAAQLTNTDNVYAILQAFTAAIQTDPSSGGADLQCDGGTQKLSYASDDKGTAAYLFFSLQIQARPVT